MGLRVSYSTYWQTVRHLKTVQLFHQVRQRLFPPRLTVSPPSITGVRPLTLVRWPSRRKSYLGGGRFRFLNREHDLGWPINWEAPGLPHLWKYNLHYFDYLHQPGMDWNTGLKLIEFWIQGHPASEKGVGWEPYPLSLRLVNWIKFFSSANPLPSEIVRSLWLQAINLRRQVEHHLLGNHLFVNGKALWFAGVFLKDSEFAQLGRKIILKELAEQFLPDGGHFELSPMYHSIVLEDLLDLVNLCHTSGQPEDIAALSALRERASRSLAWLGALIDDEGRFPLLNDSAYGVSSSYAELQSYAQRLGVKPCSDGIPKALVGKWSGWNLSGYWVLKHGPFRLVFDTAPLGPDYLLGHAHCDMLALLLDFDGRNILTDTGVYEYEEGERRQYSRGTKAHNTVVLDGLEQAEMWKSFRVGRRGHPSGLMQNGHILSSSHTGFSIWRRRLFHKRTISFKNSGFEITDLVRGPEGHHFEAYFHFAPDVRIEQQPEGGFLINQHLILEPWGANVRLTTSEYYPEFGRAEERPCLILSGRFFQSTSFGLQCTYSS